MYLEILECHCGDDLYDGYDLAQLSHAFNHTQPYTTACMISLTGLQKTAYIEVKGNSNHRQTNGSIDEGNHFTYIHTHTHDGI